MSVLSSDEMEVLLVTGGSISCPMQNSDGANHQAIDHPKIFLSPAKEGEPVQCSYCGRRYRLAAQAEAKCN